MVKKNKQQKVEEDSPINSDFSEVEFSDDEDAPVAVKLSEAKQKFEK